MRKILAHLIRNLDSLRVYHASCGTFVHFDGIVIFEPLSWCEYIRVLYPFSKVPETRKSLPLNRYSSISKYMYAEHLDYLSDWTLKLDAIHESFSQSWT